MGNDANSFEPISTNSVDECTLDDDCCFEDLSLKDKALSLQPKSSNSDGSETKGYHSDCQQGSQLDCHWLKSQTDNDPLVFSSADMRWSSASVRLGEITRRNSDSHFSITRTLTDVARSRRTSLKPIKTISLSNIVSSSDEEDENIVERGHAAQGHSTDVKRLSNRWSERDRFSQWPTPKEDIETTPRNKSIKSLSPIALPNLEDNSSVKSAFSSSTTIPVYRKLTNYLKIRIPGERARSRVKMRKRKRSMQNLMSLDWNDIEDMPFSTNSNSNSSSDFLQSNILD